MAAIERTPEEIAAITSKPPYIQIDGAFNVRKLPAPVNIYRSGSLHELTPKGASQLKELGIKTLFDLRASKEVAEWKPPTVDGLEVKLDPDVELPAATVPAIDGLLQLHENDATSSTFVRMYLAVVDRSAKAIGAIFKYWAAHPEGGFLFHCSAGKDRTGVTAALIMSYLGVEDDKIADDYAFSEVGLLSNYAMMSEVMKLLTPNTEKYPVGLKRMGYARREYILDFLKAFREKYGSVEKYLQEAAGLGPQDLEALAKLCGKST